MAAEWYLGKFLRQVMQAPATETMHRLFTRQHELIEHKFPTNHIAVHEYLISNAGDIYREMTRRYPHYEYIEEKWASLHKYAFRADFGLTSGDWEELTALLQEPYYKPQRDAYMQNLQILKTETEQADIDPQRKKIMMESLKMIEALIAWFESLDPAATPTDQLDRLTEAIAKYFPREFWK